MLKFLHKLPGTPFFSTLIATFFVLTLALFSTPAEAIRLVGGEPDSYIYTAETHDKATEQGQVEAGGILWNCRGYECVTELVSDKPDAKDCRALARKVGSISSYGHEETVLSPNALSRCNARLHAVVEKVPTNAPSARTTTLAELERFAGKCSDKERPDITFTPYPDVDEAWPRQYIQLSWSISDHLGRSWPHKVFLRRSHIQKPGKPEAESVSSIWTLRVKVEDLPEGANHFFITTHCGVSEVVINKAARPVIDDATPIVLRGNEVHIYGRNFRSSNPDGFREVRVTEPGQTKALEVVEWSDTEITALVQEDVLPGYRELFVDTGPDRGHRRASNRIDLTVVKRESFPSINIIKVLEELFTGAAIHLNNRGERVKGSTHLAGTPM